LPPDVLTLDGFSGVLAGFYREAQLAQRWQELAPAYDGLLGRLREPLNRVVLLETSYLREILRAGPRRFIVYSEPLVGSRTNIRNIGDEYVVVLNPALDSTADVRHAFLHFLIDPLPIRHVDELVSFTRLLQVANRAPRLPTELRNDLPAFFAENMVRSVELRLRRLKSPQLETEIRAAEADGYVLVAPLVSALATFEASEPAMSLYFSDVIRSIDVIKESERLRTVAFAPASHSQAGEVPEVQSKGGPPAGLSPAQQGLLAEGDRFIAAQQPEAAAAAFEQVLAGVPGQPRALYGLAVASVLRGDAEGARRLFDRIVAASTAQDARLQPDGYVLAWSRVYLGRLYDLAGTRDEAVTQYRAALSVPDAPEPARAAAQRGLDQEYRPAARTPAAE
jgi:hypothetical protein